MHFDQVVLHTLFFFAYVSHGLNMDTAPSCQVADILRMAEEYVEGNCGSLDLMSEVRILLIRW